MEPATADPSLLTDTSDTTGSDGTVNGVETVGSVLVGSVFVIVQVMLRVIVIYSPVTFRVKEPLISGEV